MYFYLFLRYCFSRRASSLIRLVSWVCMTGVTFSVAALILIVSIMGGLGQAIKDRLLSKTAHLIISFEKEDFKKNFPEKLFSKTDQPNKKSSILLAQKDLPPFFSFLTEKQKAGIKKAVLFEKQDLILKSSQGFKGVSAIGYKEEQWDKKIPELETENTLLPESPPSPLLTSQKKEVLLNRDMALEMGISPGDEIHFIPLAGLLLPPSLLPPIKTFRVRGILTGEESKEQSFFIYHKQGTMDFGPFSKINYRSEIQLQNPEKVEDYQKLFKNYKVQNWKERNSTLFFALKMEKFIISLFLALALVISCLGISSALFLLMTQKTEDIAILQAMGLSQKEITQIFTRIGLSLSLIGLFFGSFLGIAGTLFLKYNQINILPEMYQDRTLPAVFLPKDYLIILIIALLTAWLSSYLPTKYLSQIRLADLLKSTRF